jgi:hypothetical protein
MTLWLWLYDYDCMTMTVMTENKLETNQQQEQEEEVEKWYLEPLLAVKNKYVSIPSHVTHIIVMHPWSS